MYPCPTVQLLSFRLESYPVLSLVTITILDVFTCSSLDRRGNYQNSYQGPFSLLIPREPDWVSTCEISKTNPELRKLSVVFPTQIPLVGRRAIPATNIARIEAFPPKNWHYTFPWGWKRLFSCFFHWTHLLSWIFMDCCRSEHPSVPGTKICRLRLPKSVCTSIPSLVPRVYRHRSLTRAGSMKIA